jgi:hypothetical protein
VDDKPRCTNCGALTFLTRRSPAAEHALAYERQTFTCAGCGQEFERVVDAEGKPVEVADAPDVDHSAGTSLARQAVAHGDA